MCHHLFNSLTAIKYIYRRNTIPPLIETSLICSLRKGRWTFEMFLHFAERKGIWSDSGLPLIWECKWTATNRVTPALHTWSSQPQPGCQDHDFISEQHGEHALHCAGQTDLLPCSPHTWVSFRISKSFGLIHLFHNTINHSFSTWPQ